MSVQAKNSFTQAIATQVDSECKTYFTIGYIIHVCEHREWDNGDTLYGIECVLRNEDGEIESAFASDVTTDLKFAKEIVSVLAKGQVTPVTLLDILYDIIE